MTNVVLRQFGDKAAGFTSLGFAGASALTAPGDMQRALGAGDADVHQSALFLDLPAVHAFTVRQDAFLHADQEHVAEFQPFRRVQGGKLDRVCFLLAAFQHAHQGDGLGELQQGGFVGLALARQPADEVHDVVPLALGGARLLAVVEEHFVREGAQQVVEHFARRILDGAFLHALDEAAEGEQVVQLLVADVLLKFALEGGLEQRNVSGGGVLAKTFQRGVPDALLRRCRCADEGGVVISLAISRR
jgi:hypothetical protein